MLMPIRQDLTEGLATRSYESRLRAFSELFTEMRATTRESSLARPFSDIVDRLRTIHGVTIAIDDHKLLLTVHFDRPWEPYIRVIWEQLGHLFDMILCNCDGYVDHHNTELGFEAFAAWIRKHQIDASTFYMNSNHTVDDVIYLDRLEREVRIHGATPTATARLGVEAPEVTAEGVRNAFSDQEYVEYIKLGVRAVAGFHALTTLYAKGTRDHRFLLRGARSVLPESEFPKRRDWLRTARTIRALAVLQTVFDTELDWFENWGDELPKGRAPLPPPTLKHNNRNVQGGIATPYKADVGCVALFQIQDEAQARKFLHGFSAKICWGARPKQQNVYRNIGFTAQGLKRIGLPEQEWVKLPHEFREGMAARAGLIGDLRINHPDHWVLPERYGTDPFRRPAATRRVNLESVDVVIQLRRLAEPESDKTGLDLRLGEELQRIVRNAQGGLAFLSVQCMYRRGEPGAAVEHFGFRDGLSNPQVRLNDANDPDTLAPGDMFLGLPNSRDERQAAHWEEPLFKEGSFLVIRKLSQDVRALHEAVDTNIANRAALRSETLERRRDQLLAQLMGRTKRGVPLVKKAGRIDDNRFNYADDPQGDRSPLFSHVRRTNPRDGVHVPRIIRRGMSYGAPYAGDNSAMQERGIIFQAYNASLAEQFEVIQRWVSGGNGTVPYSRQSDPFLGVPDGEPRILRLANGDRINLGDKIFVRLMWGLYLFMPSRAGLEQIAGERDAQRDWADEGRETIERLPAVPAEQARSDLKASQTLSNETEAVDKERAKSDIRAWKTLLEEKEPVDKELHRGVWEAIRKSRAGVLRTPFGVLVSRADLINEVLTDDGQRFSAEGYQERLRDCIGANYLGMDKAQHDANAAAITNGVFHAISMQQGFDEAFRLASELLEGLRSIGGQATIPLHTYADLLLAEVSKHWFGVPDGLTVREGLLNMRALADNIERLPYPPPLAADVCVHAGGESRVGEATAHCPMHVLSSSRFVFQPRPSGFVRATATQEGQRLKKAIERFVARCQLQNRWPTQLLRELENELPNHGLQGEMSMAVLGALLGFMPTAYSNFLATTSDWLREGDFWTVQNTYIGARLVEQSPFAAATSAIEPRLIRAMARRPVPAMIHRRATRDFQLGEYDIKQGDLVVLGLVSATAESGFNDVTLAFGGDYDAPREKPVHACPGRKLGMGTLLAMIAALFELKGALKRGPANSALLYEPEP